MSLSDFSCGGLYLTNLRHSVFKNLKYYNMVEDNVKIRIKFFFEELLREIQVYIYYHLLHVPHPQFHMQKLL